MPPDPGTIADQLRTRRDVVYQAGTIAGMDSRVFDIWPTGLTAAAGEFLQELVIAARPTRTIETGLAFGLSASFILEGALRFHGASGVLPDSAIHIAVDPYQRRDWGNSGLRLLDESGAGSLVRFIENDSTLALPALLSDGVRFDFAFIDGGHNFEFAFLDLFHVQRLMAPSCATPDGTGWFDCRRRYLDAVRSRRGGVLCEQPRLHMRSATRVVRGQTVRAGQGTGNASRARMGSLRAVC